MPLYGYVFTLNNYSEAQEQEYRSCVGRFGIKYILFGKEVGEQGTPHLQGYLQVNHDKTSRLNAGLPCKKHVRALGNYQQNYDYCTKQENFFEAGEADKTLEGKKQGKRNDLEEIQKEIKEGKSMEEICETHFETVAKYPRFIKEQVEHRNTKKARDSLRSELEELPLYTWQTELLAVVDAEPHPRQIHWIWETTGNVGKSTFANYLAVMKNACVLDAGKKADLAYIFAQNPTKVVVIDLPRTMDCECGKMDHLYNIAEQMKNCRLTTTKYDSKTIYFPCPHVIFFANFPPKMDKWSEDRYNITRL